MFVSVPIGRFRRPARGTCIKSLQGKDVEELGELFKFWRELPYELLSVEKTLESFLQCEGWKLISPYEVDLTSLKDDMPEGYVRRGIEVSLKTRPMQYREMFTHLVFERCIERNKDDGINRMQYCDCFGVLEDCAVTEGGPSVRISKGEVLKAHQHCEEVLAVELARLKIDPSDFLIFGSKARRTKQIPDHFCVEQTYGKYELPDLSLMKDQAEKNMLERVFSVCKQLESQLLNRFENAPSPTAPELSNVELAEKRKECGVRNRELMDRGDKVEERLAILKSEFPELDLDKNRLNRINRTYHNEKNAEKRKGR